MEFQIAGIRFRVVERSPAEDPVDDPGHETGHAPGNGSMHDVARAIVHERYAAYSSPPTLPAVRLVDLRVSSAPIALDAERTGADVTYERHGDRIEVTRLDF